MGGIVYGKPCHQGINKNKCSRNLRSIAEERAGRKLGGLRGLNSYWVAEDARHKWYEVVMVDPFHKVIRDDPRINWICKPVMKHHEVFLQAQEHLAVAPLPVSSPATDLTTIPLR